MDPLSNRIVIPLVALVLTVSLPTASGAQAARELQREPQRRPELRPELRLERGPIRDVQVLRAPDVVGKPLADARTTLQQMGLRPGREDVLSMRNASPGTVVRQEPAAGAAVKRGEPVHLWIAARASRDDVGGPTTDGPKIDPRPDGAVVDRPRQTVVPELIGGLASDAPAKLQRSALRLGAQREQESSAPAGTVLRQTPPPRERALIGSAVDIVVAVPIRVTVPNLVGTLESDVPERLRQARLRTGGGRREESRAPAGTVVRQSPDPGTTVEIGTPVHVVVAVPSRVTVPNLVGTLESDVPERVRQARLRMGGGRHEESRAPAGTVVRQSPDPGTSVEIGTPVHVVVAAPIRVTVPNLVGTLESDVPERVRQARLRMGGGRREESRAPAGTVVRQSPDPGTQVDVGALVDVVVATPIQVTVPDLIGARESDVPGRLDGAQLRLGSRQRQESEALAGTVVSQTPAPRSRVPIGTPVSVVVADPILVSVPKVTGLSPTDARRLLAERRLLLGRQREEESSAQPGLIVTQLRPIGARVQPGTAVDVVVAIAPSPAVPPAPPPPPIVPDPPRVSDTPPRGDTSPPAGTPPAPPPPRVTDTPPRGDASPPAGTPPAPPPPRVTDGPPRRDDRPPVSGPPSAPSPVGAVVPAAAPVTPPAPASPPPRPPSTLRWTDVLLWGIGSMLGLAAVGSALYHFRPRRMRPPRPERSGPSITPRIAFASRYDPGSIRLSPAGSLVAGPGLQLVSGLETDRPHLDSEHLVTTAAHDGGRDDDDR